MEFVVVFDMYHFCEPLVFWRERRKHPKATRALDVFEMVVFGTMKHPGNIKKCFRLTQVATPQSRNGVMWQ